jgi:hypothetical protein
MKRIIFALIVTLVARPTFAADAKQDPKPQVQVCFVLDTTGSMSGLI